MINKIKTEIVRRPLSTGEWIVLFFVGLFVAKVAVAFALEALL